MLPNPKEFSSYKIKFKKNINFIDSTPSYDLDQVINTFKSNNIPKGFVGSLINPNLLKTNSNVQKILKQYIGFDSNSNSLVIILSNKVAAVQRSYGKNGLIKWKTFGSKKHLEYSINDEVVFVVYGMAEILLCKILGISFIGFQADSIAKSVSINEQFQKDIKPLLENKKLILLLDNDDSCRSTIEPLRNDLNGIARVIPIEMQNLYDYHIICNGGKNKELPEKFDFRDLSNEINDKKLLLEILNDLVGVYGND